MRAILALIVVALLMGLAGWITFGHSPGRTSINIETDKIQHDTNTAVENTEKMIDQGTRAIKQQNTNDETGAARTTDKSGLDPIPAPETPTSTKPAESH